MKESAFRDRAYLDTFRNRQCLAWRLHDCSGDVCAAHVGPRGVAHKASDSTCTPLCFSHHTREHSGQISFWRSVFEQDHWLMLKAVQALNLTSCLKYLEEQDRLDEMRTLIRNF